MEAGGEDDGESGMPRPVRVEFAGVIYHAISRGNARQWIFLDDKDAPRFREGLDPDVLAGKTRCPSLFRAVQSPPTHRSNPNSWEQPPGTAFPAAVRIAHPKTSTDGR